MDKIKPSKEREICVACGEETLYDRNEPIRDRLGFFEGVGQLCPKCLQEYCAQNRDVRKGTGLELLECDQNDEHFLKDFKGRIIISKKAFSRRSPENQTLKLGFYAIFVKRFMDFALAAIGLTLLSPLFIVIAIAIKRDSEGPVFFKQKRFGKNKRLFMMYKFRSMYTSVNPNTPTRLLNGAKSCITPVGAFLRKTSLDELPQIVNIFKGDMAIVGPRPVVESEVDLIVERDKYGANAIRPGLTGWAQINGRDEVPVDLKAKLDGEYARRVSFAFDLRCFFATIFNVFAQKGITEGSEGFDEASKRKKNAKK